jgi:hypothetical protein
MSIFKDALKYRSEENGALCRRPDGIEGWNDHTKQLLIYTIARDNEVGRICDELSEEQLMVLAATSMSSEERDAKWQLAEQSGKHPPTNQKEKLLLELAVDADEYVRRRSLMALADSGSGRAEQLAITAWQSGKEYQQMACLQVLWRINSPLRPAPRPTVALQRIRMSAACVRCRPLFLVRTEILARNLSRQIPARMFPDRQFQDSP